MKPLEIAFSPSGNVTGTDESQREIFSNVSNVYNVSLEIMQQYYRILFTVGNMNVELMKHRYTISTEGRVGSDFLSAIAGRVNVSPGRVQEKWPVDNSVLDVFSLICRTQLDY